MKLINLNTQLNNSNKIKLAISSTRNGTPIENKYINKSEAEVEEEEAESNNINKEHIANNIYITSENRVRQYHLLFDFISSNLKDMNQIFKNSQSNVYINNNINVYEKPIVKNQSNNEDINNIENLKTDFNEPDFNNLNNINNLNNNNNMNNNINNFSFLRENSLEKIDEVTSILTMFDNTIALVKQAQVHNLSNCDFNCSDIDEFNSNLIKYSKQNVKIDKNNQNTNNKDNCNNPKFNENIFEHNLQNNIQFLPKNLTTADVNPIVNPNHRKSLNCTDGSLLLKVELSDFKHDNNERYLNDINDINYFKNKHHLSPIKMLLNNESIGGITFNFSLDNRDVAHKESKLELNTEAKNKENKEENKEVNNDLVVTNKTSIIDFDYFSDIGDLDKTVKEYSNLNDKYELHERCDMNNYYVDKLKTSFNSNGCIVNKIPVSLC